MTDLSTTYLGLKLKSPLVASANPIAEDRRQAQQMIKSGASAIVLPSLFEEQLEHDQLELFHQLTYGADSNPEGLTYLPDHDDFSMGPDNYLDTIRNYKSEFDVPIIASLNGQSIGGWTDFAKQMQDAGADALELNIYRIVTDIDKSSLDVEDETIEIVKEVASTVSIPVAVKLSPFYTNMANMAKRVADAGAKGLVLFNRFYQPDIDLEELQVTPNVILSNPQALRLPLRWIAILYGRVPVDFAGTSGIHNGSDAVKMLLAGATVTMMASAILKNGASHFATVEKELIEWMQEHEYESVSQMRGSLSQQNSPEPADFERAQYVKTVSKIPKRYRYQLR